MRWPRPKLLPKHPRDSEQAAQLRQMKLQPEAWQDLFVALFKRVERRDPALAGLQYEELKELAHDWQHSVTSGSRVEMLKREIELLERRDLSRGALKQTRDDLLRLRLYWRRTVRGLKELRKSPKSRNDWLTGLRALFDTLDEKGKKAPVTNRVIHAASHFKPEVAASEIIGHVFGFAPEYLRRKFWELDQAHPILH